MKDVKGTLIRIIAEYLPAVIDKDYASEKLAELIEKQ